MLKQILAVTALNLRTVPARLGTSMVIVIGIGGVVGVLVALLAMGAGFKATLASTGRADRVILLRGGANDELSSVMSVETANIVKDLPGIKKDGQGLPIAIAERYVLTDVRRRGSQPGDSGSNVVVRGTSPDVFRVRPETRIIAGRMFESGKREIVVGSAALNQYEGLEIGKNVEVRDGDWPVVGIFSSGGDVHESEIWVDVTSLHAALRQPAYANVTAQLEDASKETFQAFKDKVTTDPRLNLSVQREPDYYASRAVALEKFIRILGYSVATIMAIGAVFGALNTMYAAVSTRTVEIATLRALGFGAAPVVVSVLIESVLLALGGALLGAGIAYVIFNGYTVSTLNFQTFSQVAFAFRVTPELLVTGIAWATIIGFFGGLFPAVRAARMPVADALRAG
jgi:putative ABC transport system permease protein